MSPCSRPLVALLVALLALGLLPGVLLAAPAPAASAPDASVPGQLLIAFEPGTARAEQDAAVARRGGRVVQEFPNLGALLIELPANATAMAALGLAAEPAVRYAQPNYTYTLGQLPDDTRLGDLWGLHNTGQAGGTADADIDAPAAWDLTTGGAEVVVGVVDSGILYTHPDLADNIWSAPAGWNLNGCGPGTHGYRRAPGDPSGSACDPTDENGHGTHVAGTIGARGDNGRGVVGVNWAVRLMALRAFDRYGYSTTASAITVIDYAIKARQAGVNLRVLNASWTGPMADQALLEQIDAANAVGILVVAAAGNGGGDLVGDDNATSPQFPASYGAAPYNRPNVIAVAATDRNDQLAGFSNYGATSVHLGAPGVGVLSTVLDAPTTVGEDYGTKSGTSMATPHVAGAAALILGAPGLGDLGVVALRERLLNCGDPVVALAGKTTTGKRLNVDRAVRGADGCPTPTMYSFTLQQASGGSATANPGPGTYAAWTEIALAATPNPDQLFVGWLVDGQMRSYVNAAKLVLNGDRTVAPLFAPRQAFGDLAIADASYEAITQLAARGIIRGYAPATCAALGHAGPCFGPQDQVSRAQMAALIARALGWDTEDWGNTFPDRQGTDDNLWRNVGTLAHYGVAKGYANGKFGPHDKVTHAQTLSFIARGLVAKAYWLPQTVPPAPIPYGGVLQGTGHQDDVATFLAYTQAAYGGVPDHPANGGFADWNSPGSRGWFARALWAALQSHFDVAVIP